MTGFAQFIGYATMIGTALIALVLAWSWALTRIGRRCMESKEFFALVVQYTRGKKDRRVMGIDE